MNCNLYPTLPTEPSAPLDPQSYHLNMFQRKQQELLRLKERYKKKHEKYSKTLDQLTWLSACLSSLSVASGISSVETLSTFIDLPVSIPLGAVSLAGASVSGMATLLTKNTKKLVKVTKLVNILTLALGVFKMSVSKVLNDGRVIEQEFSMLQTFCLALNELANVYHKLEAETRIQLQKVCSIR